MLLVDAGNTRLKWRLVDGAVEQVLAAGAGAVDDPEVFAGLDSVSMSIGEVAVSTVGSEQSMKRLEMALSRHTRASIQYCWPKRSDLGIVNSYPDVSKMGADRWHAMTAGWRRATAAFAVLDAGSAVTVDYIDDHGEHLGGYILPGLIMMRRSLRIDAARVGFEQSDVLDCRPGRSTGECVNHGLAWLTGGIVAQVREDVVRLGLKRVLVTGGDAPRLIGLGLDAEHCPDLVFEGLYLAAVSGTSRS